MRHGYPLQDGDPDVERGIDFWPWVPKEERYLAAIPQDRKTAYADVAFRHIPDATGLIQIVTGEVAGADECLALEAVAEEFGADLSVGFAPGLMAVLEERQKRK